MRLPASPSPDEKYGKCESDYRGEYATADYPCKASTAIAAEAARGLHWRNRGGDTRSRRLGTIDDIRLRRRGIIHDTRSRSWGIIG